MLRGIFRKRSSCREDLRVSNINHGRNGRVCDPPQRNGADLTNVQGLRRHTQRLRQLLNLRLRVGAIGKRHGRQTKTSRAAPHPHLTSTHRQKQRPRTGVLRHRSERRGPKVTRMRQDVQPNIQARRIPRPAQEIRNCIVSTPHKFDLLEIKVGKKLTKAQNTMRGRLLVEERPQAGMIRHKLKTDPV